MSFVRLFFSSSAHLAGFVTLMIMSSVSPDTGNLLDDVQLNSESLPVTSII